MSRFLGGTLIAEDVRDLAEHQRRLSDPDGYRPSMCPRCGFTHVHVHSRPERHPQGDSSLPPVVVVLQFRCASSDCGATWRVLPLFLARHLWHSWKAIEHSVVPGPGSAEPASPAVAERTQQRWRARLASAARVIVVLLAASVGTALEAIAKEVGLLGTRRDVARAYAVAAESPWGEGLSSLGALLHRLERGIRLM